MTHDQPSEPPVTRREQAIQRYRDKLTAAELQALREMAVLSLGKRYEEDEISEAEVEEWIDEQISEELDDKKRGQTE